MKRLLILIAGALAVVALGAAPAGAETLDACLHLVERTRGAAPEVDLRLLGTSAGPELG